jgi:hypothetical protein
MSDAEPLYDALAAHIDAVGEDATPLFLAKAALALGHALGDPERALAILSDCAQDLGRGA